MRQMTKVRKSKKVDFLRPDAKSQVTIEYVNGKPKRIDAVVVSTQHSDSVANETLREAVMELVIKKALPKKMIDKQTKFFINPTGRFVIGGPYGDAGLTGRKIIVDTYGGAGRHGGGAFSGKDPSKVDRSAAYYARYVAKNIVKAGLAHKAEVQLAYAIGVAEPVGVHVNTFGTSKIDEDKLSDYIKANFDMTPRGIINQLKLLRPIYRPTAAYGHFGRKGFTWEKTDRARELARALGGAKGSVPAKVGTKKTGVQKPSAKKTGAKKASAKKGSAPSNHKSSSKSNGAATRSTKQTNGKKPNKPSTRGRSVAKKATRARAKGRTSARR